MKLSTIFTCSSCNSDMSCLTLLINFSHPMHYVRTCVFMYIYTHNINYDTIIIIFAFFPGHTGETATKTFYAFEPHPLPTTTIIVHAGIRTGH